MQLTSALSSQTTSVPVPQKGEARINKGKGGKDRVVPVGKTAVQYMKRYITEVRDRYLAPIMRNRKISGTETALFLGDLGRKMTGSAILYTVKKYVRVKFPGREITTHSFRHTCGTHMLRGGAPLPVIQQMLGHSHIESTQIYTRVVPIDLKKAHDKYHPRKREH
jgi:integrase/recombinase XerD